MFNSVSLSFSAGDLYRPSDPSPSHPRGRAGPSPADVEEAPGVSLRSEEVWR
jgi:hypothetical protein